MSGAFRRRDLSPKILLVEDNPGDILLMQQAFGNLNLRQYLQIAHNGDMAIDMLRQVGQYENQERADLVLLDLNLPGKNGHEVLEEIKSDIKLRKIPVIVLSSSSEQADIDRVYRMHANSYIVKPVSQAQYKCAVESIEEYWFDVALLAS